MFDEEWTDLARAIRLKDFDAAEDVMNRMVRADWSAGRAESIAKGRAQAETILRRNLRDSGAEFVPTVLEERAAA